jgi:ribosomal protein S12 methylthiotransferase
MTQTTLLGKSKIAFITLGCAKNEVDSDKMRARVLAAGFEVIDDPELASAVIINTCSFITEATQEAIGVILEACALSNVERGEAQIIVTGCMPSRYGSELGKELPEVAAFVSCEDEHNIVEILLEAVGAEPSPYERGDHLRSSASTAVPTRFTRTCSAPWAYVKIADGCDRNCSFCTIPLIKGHYRSVPAEEILAEVSELVQGGVREIILIAQDTGIWGRDLRRADFAAHGNTAINNLATLLDALAARHGETWFRVMYLQPQGITDELLSVMAKHANICNYLDIPLQHAASRILKEMNRKGSGPEYLELLKRIRTALPSVALRTSVIAGFPGETKAEAKELERFIEQANFDYVGVFVYSQEDGTAAGQRSDQVPMRTRKARAQRLRDLADNIGFERAAAHVDTVQEVLVVEFDEDGAEADSEGDGVSECSGAQGLLGRTKGQAPEVDGMVHLKVGSVGDLVSVRIVEAYCYDLDGEVV